MIHVKITVNGTTASATVNGTLTSGLVGATYEVAYDQSWNKLQKIVVFKAGNVTRNAINGIIPAEVLETPFRQLEVGIQGQNEEGTVVVPTIWTTVGGDYGVIYEGANPSEDPTVDPENPIWQQAITAAENALPKSGGTMSGPVNMGGKEITDAKRIDTNQVHILTPGGESETARSGVMMYASEGTDADDLTFEGYETGNAVRLHNVADPEAPQDAVTLKYLQEHGSHGGVTNHGDLTDRDQPNQHPIRAISDLESTLNAIGNTAMNALPVTGGKMSGDINMDSHAMTNVADPADPGDAVNLKYLQEHGTGGPDEIAMQPISDPIPEGTKMVIDPDEPDPVEDLGMVGVTVGQLARAKKVDAQGHVTEWEPIDEPSGGGGSAPTGPWKQVVDYTVPDGGPVSIEFTESKYPGLANARQVIITTDFSGQWLQSWSGLTVYIGPKSVTSVSLTAKNKQVAVLANADAGYWGGFFQHAENQYFDSTKWVPIMTLNAAGTATPGIYVPYNVIKLILSNNATFPAGMKIRIFLRG